MENASLMGLNGEIEKQDRQQYALMATLTKQQLTFNLKNTLIVSKPDTPDISDS
jgi:hypothetical protein